MTVLRRLVRLLFALPFTLVALAFAQNTETANPAPPAYLGASERVDSAHIPPIPNASFSARAEIESTQKLSDGTTFTHRTYNVIAGDFRGRTHNEFRAWNPPDGSDPKLNYSILYDPDNHTRILIYPSTHLARFVMKPPTPTPSGAGPNPIPSLLPSERRFGHGTSGRPAIEGNP
jgi:hypothetical protein